MTSSHSPPEPISPQHDLQGFDCGVEDFNDWLVRGALANNRDGAARTFVAAFGQRVTGYYALTLASVSHLDAPVTSTATCQIPFQWRYRPE